ncbi:MAG: hypothetical protein AAFW73_11895 [Bacteroidota bacterium]
MNAKIPRFPLLCFLFLSWCSLPLHAQSDAELAYQKAIEAVGLMDEGRLNASIAADPQFASNYYRLAQIFLNSSDKVPGLLYGEIFMNLERTTARTQEVSEWLFDTYRESVTLSGDSFSVDFCEIILDASTLKTEEWRLPFCAIFAKNFLLASTGQEQLNLSSLAVIRSTFLQIHFQTDALDYPNVLFDYHQLMEQAGVFKAYNHYLFQVSNFEEFEQWRSEHEAAYQTFVDWYTDEANFLLLDPEHLYLRNH